jgi:hypothetical protein
VRRAKGDRLLRASFAILAFLFAYPAPAQTFYKWTDKDGKVHYADKPPVGFRGEVTAIETDAAPPPAPRPAPKVQGAEPQGEEKAPDLATRRRAERERLGARVTAARAKVEKARKALADGEDPQDDEKQIVQQLHNRDAQRPERTPPPRLKCMATKTPDGRAAWNCPTPVPGESYFDRQKILEEALRTAEDELAEAERAYRRGVD